MLTRRQFIKATAATGAALSFNLVGNLDPLGAVAAAPGLSDPAAQPMFSTFAPNALDPTFAFWSPNNKYKIAMTRQVQMTGLVDAVGQPLSTTVWGYGRNGPGGTWPGRTFVAQRGEPVEVMWQNKLPFEHLVPVDTSLHWAYSLPGYERYSIPVDGPPVVTHLH